ncbi:MAG: peptidylprolyl isomerase [candidate division WOR-3 bacterium]|nr:peptidylprolyl isomerase [candidate division WOR-3 bacterium]
MAFLLTLLLVGGFADRVVGAVDAEPILSSEVEAMVTLVRLETPFPEAIEDSLRLVLLDRLIAQKLIFKKAALDSTIEIDREEIAQSVERQLQAFYEQLDSFPETRAELQEAGLTHDRLRQLLMNQGRFQAIIQQMFASRGKIQPYVSPNEVREYYERHKDSIAVVPGYISMAYIAFSIRPSAAEQARIERKIMEILDILSRGGEFDVLAESFSEDPRTRSRGGSLGWVKRGDLLPEIDSVIFSLPAGRVSPPVPSREGYHLFLVEARSGDKVYVRHILFKQHVTRQDTLRVLELADKIREEIVSGELTFAEAARTYSEDFTTSEQGGFIGEVPLAALTPPFDSVAAIIDSGQVSKPFVSDMGVHLLYAEDKREESVLSFDEMQVQIRNYLAALKQEEWLEDLIAEAQEEFYVEKRF